TFTQVASYHFPHAERVFFNPFNSNEVWVASNGNGFMMGNALQPAGAFQFSAANYTANENGGSAAITVTRSGDVSTGMSVDYQTTGGTATAGADFVASSGTLIFGVGQASATFSVPIRDDSFLEANETINLA